MNEFVLRSMKEEGFDLSNETRKQVTKEMAEEADKIILITNEDVPDYLKNKPKVTFWDIPDGKELDYDFHLMIQGMIKEKVEELVKEIG